MKIRLLILALVTLGFSSELFAADGDTEGGSVDVDICVNGMCNKPVYTRRLTDNPGSAAKYVSDVMENGHETPKIPGPDATK